MKGKPSPTRERVLRLLPFAIAVVVLAGWEALGRLGWISALFFPAPSVIATTFVRLVRPRPSRNRRTGGPTTGCPTTR